jgi:hypothetical protein
LKAARTPLQWAAIALVPLTLAACGEAEPLAEESAGEAFLHERLAREHPLRASHEISVFCRRDRGARLACGSSVSGAGDPAAIRQRWAVDLDSSGRVTAARPVLPPEVPEPREQSDVALAAEEAEEAKARPRTTRPRGAQKRMEVVWFRITPRRRALVCIETGRGRRLFGATRTAVVSLKRAGLRLRFGRRSVLVTFRGSPSGARRHGIDIRPGKLRPLRSRSRRC